ncbi:hypothetical protein ACWDRB_55180 [Nonomuraea sp. NPDC003707]
MGSAPADGLWFQRGAVVAAVEMVLGSAADAFGRSLTLPSVSGTLAGAFAMGRRRRRFLSGRLLGPGGGGISIDKLNPSVTVQGVLDPSDPGSMCRLGLQIRDTIRDLEREAFRP